MKGRGLLGKLGVDGKTAIPRVVRPVFRHWLSFAYGAQIRIL
jgi:hypothetical protein